YQSAATDKNMEELIKINQIIGEFMGYEIIPYQKGKHRPVYSSNKYSKKVILGSDVEEQKIIWGGLDVHFAGRFTECVKYPFNT
ncbi:hypothetical protein U2088_15700, partial [Listeria monocytogenes]|uniref:hypothetical protein n=1 Tax=Listeria monocytogenes TaxID=1639 RepID=UPI002FDC50BA